VDSAGKAAAHMSPAGILSQQHRNCSTIPFANVFAAVLQRHGGDHLVPTNGVGEPCLETSSCLQVVATTRNVNCRSSRGCSANARDPKFPLSSQRDVCKVGETLLRQCKLLRKRTLCSRGESRMEQSRKTAGQCFRYEAHIERRWPA